MAKFGATPLNKDGSLKSCSSMNNQSFRMLRRTSILFLNVFRSERPVKLTKIGLTDTNIMYFPKFWT